MPQATPLDQSETNYALHIGFEHRFTDVFSVFGRAARAFRTPDVDERVSTGPAFDAFFMPLPQNFQLKTQTSHDVEVRISASRTVRSRCKPASTTWTSRTRSTSIPWAFFNINLDPTRRYGAETAASLRLSDTLLVRGGVAYIRAVFRDGPFKGNDVPLVSRFTASGGVTWNIWERYFVVDATMRYLG